METSQIDKHLLPYFPFYPTYEEWKLYSNSVHPSKDDTFYPTYEEWKLVSSFFSTATVFELFILPMRNGNPTVNKVLVFYAYLFILPMRNGREGKGKKNLIFWLTSS